MALNKYMLGELITPVEETNEGLKFTEEDVRGISIQKKLIPTKADMTGVSLRPYLVIRPDTFCYVTVTSRNGDKISIARNDTQNTFIVSSSYAAFRVTRKDVLNSEFLFMMFNRPEFDRFARFNSWGSARETFDFSDFQEMEIELPELPIQEKFARVYKSLIANRDAYARGLQDLKLTCDAYIEDLRRRMPSKTIGPYIVRSSKNSEQKYNRVLGIGQKGFISPQKQPNESLANYKIAKKYDIVYAPPMYNIKSDAIEISREEEPFVCSPIYEVFSCTGPLLAEYLLVWLKRDEFKRYAEFYALGIRNTFDFELMAEVQIPIPDEKTQRAIAALYEIYYKRKRIFEDLKARAVNLCQILIRGAIKEGAQT